MTTIFPDAPDDKMSWSNGTHRTMWLIAGVALWIVPLSTCRYARRNSSPHVFCFTGIALGVVASVASLGTYGLYWLAGLIGLLGLPLAAVGIVGLILTLFHRAPGYYLAIMLGLVPDREVVHGVGLVYIEALNSVFWATLYGALGYALDSVIRRRQTRSRESFQK
jgi:hypothetical protein